MSEHAAYALETDTGIGWGAETVNEPAATDSREGGKAFVTPAGNIVYSDDTSNDERALGWEFTAAGFGGKLGFGAYDYALSSLEWIDVHPTEAFALLAGTGNGSNALKVAAFTEAGGFGAEVSATLSGVDGDEVLGAIFHPSGDYAFHWGILTAVGLHSFSAGTLSDYTNLSATYGGTQDGAMWHPNGTYLAVFASTGSYLWINAFSAGAIGSAVTIPSFTTGTWRGGAWSPDGTRLAASYGSNTYIFDFVEGTGALTLAITIASVSYNLAWVDDSTIIRKDGGTTSSTFSLLTLGATAVDETAVSSTTFANLESNRYWRFAISDGWIVFPVSVSPYVRAIQVAGTFEPITSDVVQSGGTLVSCTRGRSSMRSYGEPETGECTFLLDNTSGNYSDLVGRHVRLSAVYSATTYYLWYGVVQEAREFADGLQKRVAVRCYGRLIELDKEIVTDLYVGIWLHEAVGHVLDAAGWPTAARDIDTSDTFIRVFWGSGQSALSLLQSLASADGVGATFYVDGQGDFVWRSDAARWTDARSTTSRATFATSPTSDPAMWAPEFIPRREVVINKASMEVGQLVQPASLDASVVWEADGYFSIAADTPLVITCVLNAPASAIIAPVETTDYIITSGNVTSVSIDRTSGSVIELTFTADTFTVITGLQLRGDGWLELQANTPTSQVAALTSIARYGERPWKPSHAPWRYITTGKGQDLVDSVVTRSKDGLAAFRLGFAGNHTSTAMTRALDFELTDRVTVNETVIGQSHDYYIERMVHEIRAANSHYVTLELEQAVNTDPNQSTYQLIESSAAGTIASSLAPITSAAVGISGAAGGVTSSIQPLSSAATGTHT